MKTIERVLPWTDKTQWSWPDSDEKLVLVFEHVSDIDLIMKYVDKRDCCVQAGGATGLWPLRFAHYFEYVYTFEPMAESYDCLIKNTEDVSNIVAARFGLSNGQHVGSMVFEKTERDNYGAVFFRVGAGNVCTTTIDSLRLAACDLIQLDIEGHEYEALKGAVETIYAYSPTIVLEEKALPQLTRDFKAPRKLIEGFGYKEVDRMHRDVIFKRC